jgi:LacI family transcriptional regulator
VTAADVARRSNVSEATVSLALRGKPGVGEATRARVLDAALELGYAAAAPAAVRERRTHNIGVAIKVRPDDIVSINQFYGPVLAGIETVCRRHDLNLLYANVPVDEANYPTEWPRLLVENEVDGLILVGERLDEKTRNLLRQHSTPVVLADAYAPGNPFDAVLIGNCGGAFEATNHLIEQGHRRIAILGSHPDAFPSVRERTEGYERALQHYRLSPVMIDCRLHPDACRKPLADAVREHPEITAIFACNDDLAIAALELLPALGWCVPEDVSVVGFDDIPQAQAVQPALTTVQVDKLALGRHAAYTLLNRIENPAGGTVCALVRPKLVVRRSVAPRAA